MGFIVLGLGALMVAAGAYEMIAGTGNILLERGWSAYIAGAVLIGSGAVTASLGLALRSIDLMRAEFVRGAAVSVGPVVPSLADAGLRSAGLRSTDLGPAAVATALPLDLAHDHGHEIDFGPPLAPAAAMSTASGIALAEPAAIGSDARGHEFHEPEPPPVEAFDGHSLAAAAHEPEAHGEARADAPHEPVASHELVAPHEPVAPPEYVAPPEPVAPVAADAHGDWLDHSFAELEREIADHHRGSPPGSAAAPDHSALAEPAAAYEPVHADPVAPFEPQADDGLAPLHAPVAEPAAPGQHAEAAHHLDLEPADYEQHVAEPHPIEPVPHEAAPAHDPEPVAHGGATVSAREEAVPPSSQVIGRYESEGTSYVMYADGSIDAQSEAGIYRFASMAELKTFIES